MNKDYKSIVDKAVIFLRSNGYEKAVALCNEAIKFDPNEPDAYLLRGNAFNEIKEYGKAVLDFTKVIKIVPILPQPYFFRAKIYAHSGDHKKAVKDYTVAIILDPKQAFIYNNRGLSFRNMKEYEKAISDFTEAINLDPENAIYYDARGYTYFQIKDYSNAISDLTEAIRLEPEKASYFFGRGEAYYHLSEYYKAISDYTRTLELDPKFRGAYLNRANVYHKMKNYELAILDFTKEIQLNPNDASSYYNRGNVYTDLNEFEKALSDYYNAISLNSNLSLAYNGRCYINATLKNFEKALLDINKAVFINGNNPLYYLNRGSVFFNLKNYEKELSDLNRAIILDANYADAYSFRGLLYFHVGKEQEAIADHVKSLELGGDSSYGGIGKIPFEHYRTYLNDHKDKYALLKSSFMKAIESGNSECYINLSYLLDENGEGITETVKELVEKDELFKTGYIFEYYLILLKMLKDSSFEYETELTEKIDVFLQDIYEPVEGVIENIKKEYNEFKLERLLSKNTDPDLGSVGKYIISCIFSSYFKKKNGAIYGLFTEFYGYYKQYINIDSEETGKSLELSSVTDPEIRFYEYISFHFMKLRGSSDDMDEIDITDIINIYERISDLSFFKDNPSIQRAYSFFNTNAITEEKQKEQKMICLQISEREYPGVWIQEFLQSNSFLDLQKYGIEFSSMQKLINFRKALVILSKPKENKFEHEIKETGEDKLDVTIRINIKADLLLGGEEGLDKLRNIIGDIKSGRYEHKSNDGETTKAIWWLKDSVGIYGEDGKNLPVIVRLKMKKSNILTS
jgi:tetratricopeptide (TPR) repeat protein